MPFLIPAIVATVKFIGIGSLIGLGASYGLAQINKKLARDAQKKALLNAQVRTVTLREPVPVSRFIYGEQRMGGYITFLDRTKTTIKSPITGQLPIFEWLHCVITLCGHDIHSLDAIYFDGERIPFNDLGNGFRRGAGEYGFAFAEFNNGFDGDQAFPQLQSFCPGLWTPNHRQRGCASVHLTLAFDEKLYPNGMPNITFGVRGKHIFDPRDTDVLTVVSATAETPILIHSPGHGRATGDAVRVQGITGLDGANGTWKITVLDEDYFNLDGSEGTGTYTGGGEIFPLKYSNNAALVAADYMAA